jgi:hypothetical protein
MARLADFAAIAAGLLLAGFFGVVVFQMVSGRISLAGLLDTKGSGRRTFSPGRLQMLIATVVIAGRYLYSVAVNPQQAALPTLHPAELAVLGGSQAVYLGGKAIDAYLQPILKGLKQLKNLS